MMIHPRHHAFPACAPRMASGFVWFAFLTLRRLEQIAVRCEFGRRHKIRSTHKRIHSSYFPQAETNPIEIHEDSLFRFPPNWRHKLRPVGPGVRSGGKSGLNKKGTHRVQPSRLQPRRSPRDQPRRKIPRRSRDNKIYVSWQNQADTGQAVECIRQPHDMGKLCAS